MNYMVFLILLKSYIQNYYLICRVEINLMIISFMFVLFSFMLIIVIYIVFGRMDDGNNPRKELWRIKGKILMLFYD